MNPQDILNSQYTAPDLPDVSQVQEALRTVREHVARNKTPYALLAASLPIIGYGAHRAMRKTPEADAEPSLHAGPALTQPAEIQQGGDKIAQAVLARFGLDKMAWSGANVVKGVGTALGAVGGGYAGWKGTEGDNLYDRVVRTGASSVAGGAVGYGLGHAATKVPGMIRAHGTTQVPGAQQAYDAMRGAPHAPPAPAQHAPAPAPAPVRANVPAEHREKFDQIPADKQQAVADHMGWGAPAGAPHAPGVQEATSLAARQEANRAARPAPPPPPAQAPAQAPAPTVSLDAARAQADRLGKPYYNDRDHMLGDGLMKGRFQERAGQAWDTGLVPNTSGNWSMAHQLHSMSPGEHADALKEFSPDSWEHKLLTHMGPLERAQRTVA